MIPRKAQQVTWLSSCVVLSLYCWLLSWLSLIHCLCHSMCLRQYTCCNCPNLGLPGRSAKRSRVGASINPLLLPCQLPGHKSNGTLLGFCWFVDFFLEDSIWFQFSKPTPFVRRSWGRTMPSASRTRSTLLDGRGLTDLRNVSWQSVVVECVFLFGVLFFSMTSVLPGKYTFLCDVLVFVFMFCAWNILGLSLVWHPVKCRADAWANCGPKRACVYSFCWCRAVGQEGRGSLLWHRQKVGELTTGRKLCVECAMALHVSVVHFQVVVC